MSREARRQALFVLFFLIVVFGFVTTFRMGVVHGQSMMPTYQDGQVVLVNRRTWFRKPLQRGDVVLVKKDRDVLIKRVFHLPGDELTDEELLRRTFINDLADYYEQPIPTPYGQKPRLFVPEGFLVVLGDNRPGSEDSRAFGPLPESDVLGVVVASPPAPPSDLLLPPDRRISSR